MASHSHSLFIAEHADTTSEERERESMSQEYHDTQVVVVVVVTMSTYDILSDGRR